MAVDRQRARSKAHANAASDIPRGRADPKAQALASRVLAINIERVAAKQILRDIVAQGLTPELRAKAGIFLDKHPD